MPFVKVVKNKAYFKRFQTKYRRRRGSLYLLNIQREKPTTTPERDL